MLSLTTLRKAVQTAWKSPVTPQRQDVAVEAAFQVHNPGMQAKAEEAAALQRRDIGLAAQLEAARQEVFAGREALRLKQLELESAQEAAAARRRAAEQEAEALAQERQKRQRAEEDMQVDPSCMTKLSCMTFSPDLQSAACSGLGGEPAI